MAVAQKGRLREAATPVAISTVIKIARVLMLVKTLDRP